MQIFIAKYLCDLFTLLTWESSFQHILCNNHTREHTCQAFISLITLCVHILFTLCLTLGSIDKFVICGYDTYKYKVKILLSNVFCYQIIKERNRKVSLIHMMTMKKP